MRIKDFTDTIRHLTDPFNIPEARRMIAENPALTQEQFKVGGLVEPGVTHYGTTEAVAAAMTSREKETKELMKVRKKIDTWTKNWLDKSINKYEIRELKVFKEDLAKAWQKELKANPKEYVTTMRGGTPFKSTAIDGLSPNVSDRRFGKTPFKYLGEEVGDKLTIKTFWNKIFYHNQLKDKAFKKKTLDWMDHYIAGKAHVNQYNRKAYEAKTAKLADDDVIYFLSRDSGLDGHTRKAVMERAFPEANPKYRAKLDKMSKNYKMSEDILDEFFGTKNILNQASVKEHQALAKIFDVSELPKSLRLNYNMDHIYGVSEAVREIKKGNPDKKFIRSILNNTWGMSAKRNEELGTKWYSFQRKDLANKIEKGINAEANLQKLNKLTKKAYGVDNAYQVVKGNVRPTKSFVGQTQPERFGGYFKEIAKTKEGAKQIISQSAKKPELVEFIQKNKSIVRSLASQIKNMDGQTITQYKKFYPDCFKQDVGSNALRCLTKQAEKNSEKFVKNSVSIAKATEGTKTSAQMINFLRKAKTLARGTGWLLAGEAIFGPLIALPMWAQGTPKDEMAHMLTYGAFGQDREEKIQEKLSPLGRAYAESQTISEKGQALADQINSGTIQGYDLMGAKHKLKKLEEEYNQVASIFTPDPITGAYNQDLIDKAAQEVDDVTKYFEDIQKKQQKESAAWAAPKTSEVMETVIDKPGKAFIDFTLGPNWKENLPEQQNQFYKKRYPRNPRELGQHLSYDPDIPMFAEGGIAGLLKK
jgi:hypothetical protein